MSVRRPPLTRAEAASLAVGAVLLVAARIGLAIGTACVRPGLAGRARALRLLPRVDPARTGALMHAAAARLPWTSTCLEQACALVWLLALQGTSARIVIGVSRGTASLHAHAWVEHAGRVVLGAGAGGFAPLPAPLSVHPCRA